MKKRLRTGYTTGACAAAAAKAAALLLLSNKHSTSIEIPFPDGTRFDFVVNSCLMAGESAVATIIKDAGDDPDVTNKAVILSSVRITANLEDEENSIVSIIGGKGVGIVTKPGLSVPVGSAAINPVPIEMIKLAVLEAISESENEFSKSLEVKICVPEGAELAKKTLNKRLGIIGGISILGTTGIVKPISAEAWTATIRASMNVATAVGGKEIILSTGRTSEKCVQSHLNLPEEALVMMGDYLVFALEETQKHSFNKIHIATMWAKLVKGAMKVPQTHVKHGVLDPEHAVNFFKNQGVEESILKKLKGSNTAREILERLLEIDNSSVIKMVCRLAKEHYSDIAGSSIKIYLVHGTGNLLYSI